MGITGNNTSLSKAKEAKARRMADRDYYQKNAYDLKVALDSKLPGAESYWNPKATGGPLIRVISPFDPAKVLFLRVVNHTIHDPVPLPGKITITAQLEPKDFNKRPDNLKMPRDLPAMGIDGIAFITQTKPIDPVPQTDLGTDAQGTMKGRTNDQPVNNQIVTDGGSMINQFSDGVALVGSDGKGLHMGKNTIHMDKAIDSTELPQSGMLLYNPFKNWIGCPETVATPNAWEKMPDIAKIVDWANVAGYCIQALSKIYRANEALKET